MREKKRKKSMFNKKNINKMTNEENTYKVFKQYTVLS